MHDPNQPNSPKQPGIFWLGSARVGRAIGLARANAHPNPLVLQKPLKETNMNLIQGRTHPLLIKKKPKKVVRKGSILQCRNNCYVVS